MVDFISWLGFQIFCFAIGVLGGWTISNLLYKLYVWLWSFSRGKTA